MGDTTLVLLIVLGAGLACFLGGRHGMIAGLILHNTAPGRIRKAASMKDAEIAKLTDKDLDRFFRAYQYVRTVYRDGALDGDPALNAIYDRFDAEDNRRLAARSVAKRAAQSAQAAEARRELGLLMGVAPISEAGAHAALRRQMSEASNPEHFDAVRREHGWVFGWRQDRGPAPLGTGTWIVADNGRVRRLGPRDSWDDAIAEELAK